MPLLKGKSKKAFSHNVKEEMEEGKPQKQSLAIAYSMKRKKKAAGGSVESGDAEMNYGSGGEVESKIYGRGDESKQKGVHLTNHAGKGNSAAGSFTKSAHSGNTSIPKEKLHEYAKENHQEVLSHMKEDKGDRKYLAEGGEVSPMMEVTCPHCTKSFSHGGEVANSDEPIADGKPAEFDYLHLEDGLEEHETGANSGDEIGDEQEDEDRKDLVSRAMLKRKGKK